MIKWEEDFGEFASDHEWLGYLGTAHICTIGWNNDLYFYPMNHDYVEYASLSSAKRGAERMLVKFLKDAGLEVRREFLDRLKKTIPFSCSSCSFSSCTVPCRAVRDAIDQEDETTEAAR